MSRNRIGLDGCRTLAHLLQKEGSSLLTLELNNNNIDNEGAELLAGSIKHNTKLKTLELAGNDNITEIGYKSF